MSPLIFSGFSASPRSGSDVDGRRLEAGAPPRRRAGIRALAKPVQFQRLGGGAAHPARRRRPHDHRGDAALVQGSVGNRQLWRPMRPGADNLFDRSSCYWTVFGRLRPEVTLDQANDELAASRGRQLELSHPKNYNGWTLHAADLRVLVIGDYRSGLLVVLGAVGCVMLVTCANPTGLAIVRATARRQELQLGIGPRLLARAAGGLLLTESLLLAVLGDLGGVLFANWGLDLLLTGMLNGLLPRSGEIALNIPVLAVSLVLTVLTGLTAAGLASGSTAAHASAKEAFKEGVRTSAGLSARRLRAALIVAEIAIALALPAGTGPGPEFCRPDAQEARVDAERVLFADRLPSAERYNSPNKCWALLLPGRGKLWTCRGSNLSGSPARHPSGGGYRRCRSTPGRRVSPMSRLDARDRLGQRRLLRRRARVSVGGPCFHALADDPWSAPVVVLSVEPPPGATSARAIRSGASSRPVTPSA